MDNKSNDPGISKSEKKPIGTAGQPGLKPCFCIRSSKLDSRCTEIVQQQITAYEIDSAFHYRVGVIDPSKYESR